MRHGLHGPTFPRNASATAPTASVLRGRGPAEIEWSYSAPGHLTGAALAGLSAALPACFTLFDRKEG